MAGKSKVGFGDIWALGPHRLLCGDATERFMPINADFLFNTGLRLLQQSAEQTFVCPEGAASCRNASSVSNDSQQAWIGVSYGFWFFGSVANPVSHQTGFLRKSCKGQHSDASRGANAGISFWILGRDQSALVDIE